MGNNELEKELMANEDEMSDEMIAAIMELAEAAALYRRERCNSKESDEETKKKIMDTVDKALDIYDIMKDNDEAKTR